MASGSSLSEHCSLCVFVMSDVRLCGDNDLHLQEACLKYDTHTYIHPFNGPLSGTTQVSRYQKGKTNLDFTKARD